MDDPATTPASTLPAAATPPTKPGPIDKSGAEFDRSVNRNAVASVVWGMVGFAVPLIGIVAMVLACLAFRRIKRSAGEQRGYGYATAGLLTGVVSVGLHTVLVLLMIGMVGVTRSMVAFSNQSGLRLLHVQMQERARDDGVYPRHVALLAQDPDRWPAFLQVVDHFSYTPGVVVVGDFDFADWQGTQADSDAIGAAVDSLDPSEPTYEFGQFTFATLETPTARSDLFFAWRHDAFTTVWIVLFDDGDIDLISQAEFDVAWAANEAAREELGLGPIEKPVAK